MHFRSVFPTQGTDSNSLKLHGGRHTEKKKPKINHIKWKNVNLYYLLLNSTKITMEQHFYLLKLLKQITNQVK